MRIDEISVSEIEALHERIKALDPQSQKRLADILAISLYEWLVGDTMVVETNSKWVEDFMFLKQFIIPTRRRKLRKLYRGIAVDMIPEDWNTSGKRPVLTSKKPLQSWTTSKDVALDFTNANRQNWIKGKHGVVFEASPRDLDILFVMADLQECFYHLTDALPSEVKAEHETFSHSQYWGVYSELEGFAYQNEVIVRTSPDGKVPVTNVLVVK